MEIFILHLILIRGQKMRRGKWRGGRKRTIWPS